MSAFRIVIVAHGGGSANLLAVAEELVLLLTGLDGGATELKSLC